MNGSMIYTRIRSVEISIAVKFDFNGDRCQQRYDISGNRTALKCARDRRFELCTKLNNKIDETMLSVLEPKNWEFLEKIEEEKSIIVIYQLIGKVSKETITNYFFVIPTFVPPKTGCIYCIYFDPKKMINYFGKPRPYLFCEFKQEKLLEKIENKCSFFYQKNLFKT